MTKAAYAALVLCAAAHAAVVDIRGREQRAVTPPAVCLGETSNVTFHGSRTDKVESFLNIRFGADTGGANRFAPPVPYSYPSHTVQNASLPGAACPQPQQPIPDIPLFDNVTNISEDCLTLRIDRPAGTAQDASLPVMVYIFGGGDTFGQIYDGAYDPTKLVSSAATSGTPVIYAAMNYRVGIFGFAASPALEDLDSLNAGLLDQRLALEWIRDNIAAFGGDPARVTIFGESDGATGVGLQVTAYGGKVETPPFQRAIMQSGAPTADPGTASNFSANNTAAVIKMMNCTASSSEAELLCLRNATLSSLLNTAIDYENGVVQWGLDVFIPTAPSSFIPDSPSQLLRSGRFAHNIDIIAGWNENDASLFTPTTIQSDADISAFLSQSFPTITNKSIRTALRLYPKSDFQTDPKDNITSEYFRASRMYRDATFSCPAVLMVQQNRLHNPRRPGTANYLFALNQTIFSAFYDLANVSYYGVSHFSDIPFVFDQATTRYAAISTASDRTLATQISGSWTKFATSANVQGPGNAVTNWPMREGPVGVRIIGGPRPGYESIHEYESLYRRCAFWNSRAVTEQIRV